MAEYYAATGKKEGLVEKDLTGYTALLRQPPGEMIDRFLPPLKRAAESAKPLLM